MSELSGGSIRVSVGVEKHTFKVQNCVDLISWLVDWLFHEWRQK